MEACAVKMHGDVANISYNLLKTAAGGNIAIGPILLGAAHPSRLSVVPFRWKKANGCLRR